MSKHSDEKQRVDALKALIGAGAPPRSWSVTGGKLVLTLGAEAGDDCAVIETSGEISLILGSDYVRGSKFALFEAGLLDHYDLGYYLVGANISDLAAMGAQPVGILDVIRYPSDLGDRDFEALIEGMRDAARRCGATLLGGDTGSAERLIISATAVGVCERGQALTRSGSRPGDLLWLSGEIGAPAAAVLNFTETGGHALSEAESEELLASWKRVEPRVGQGRLLATKSLANACQDVSDGLRATALEMAAMSDVKLVLDASAIPLSPTVRPVAEAAGIDPLGLAMSASVDFELLFTTPPEKTDELRTAFAANGATKSKTSVACCAANSTRPREGVPDRRAGRGNGWKKGTDELFTTRAHPADPRDP
jgi:thiamine-monophosphate kinase